MMKRWNITSRDGQADTTIAQRLTSNKTEAHPTTEAPLHETKAKVKAMRSIMVEMQEDMETLNVRGMQAGTAMLMGMSLVLATRTVAVEVEVVVTIEVERDVVDGAGVMVVAAAGDQVADFLMVEEVTLAMVVIAANMTIVRKDENTGH